MPKRPKFLDGDDTFDPLSKSENSSGLSLQDASSEIYKDIAKVDKKNKRISTISIFTISPDSAQPRRAMPSAVRAAWDGMADGLEYAFMQWLNLIDQERATLAKNNEAATFFELGAFLHVDKSNQDAEQSPDPRPIEYRPGPLESAFLQIVTLAASIRRDGLTNPISVAKVSGSDGYMLETGERRWLAYHLLYLWFDGSDDNRPDEQDNWGKIPCLIVDEVNVWRQANENNARENLNAIGRARQVAVLMMDLLDGPFEPIDAFAHEREFYAQIGDASTPRGKSEQLLASMGVTNRSALSRYRSLLKLPNEIWDDGDDQNLSVEQLLDMVNVAKQESPEKAIEHHKQNVAARNITGSASSHAPGTRRHFSQLTSTVQKAGHGKKAINKQALKKLDEMRRWLDQQETIIRSYDD